MEHIAAEGGCGAGASCDHKAIANSASNDEAPESHPSAMPQSAVAESDLPVPLRGPELREVCEYASLAQVRHAAFCYITICTIHYVPFHDFLSSANRHLKTMQHFQPAKHHRSSLTSSRDRRFIECAPLSQYALPYEAA
jgi:hypothetical protein